MHTRAPMLKTLSTFALRDGEHSFLLLFKYYKQDIIQSSHKILRYSLPLDRPLSLHPPPVYLLNRPLRPVQHPGPTPQVQIAHGPALLLDHHRRRRGSGRPRGRHRQPGGGDPRAHVRRRREATTRARKLPRRRARALAHRARRGAGHFRPGAGPHGREERADECWADCTVGLVDMSPASDCCVRQRDGCGSGDHV